MKVLFIDAKAKKQILKGLEKNIGEIDEKKLGLLATVQFVNQLPNAKKLLEKKGFKIFIGKPKGPAVLAGQVLGCDASSALAVEKQVDAFLYVGTGAFHPLALAQTKKPVYLYNPFTEKLAVLPEEEKTKLLRKKYAMQSKFKDAKIIGIIATTKPGQSHLKIAEMAREFLEKRGKKVYLFVCDMLSAAELQNYPHIEAWVNTACPRLVDDAFDKPIVNATELKEIFGQI